MYVSPVVGALQRALRFSGRLAPEETINVRLVAPPWDLDPAEDYVPNQDYGTIEITDQGLCEGATPRPAQSTSGSMAHGSHGRARHGCRARHSGRGLHASRRLGGGLAAAADTAFRDHHVLGDRGDRFAALKFGHYLRAIDLIGRVHVGQAELKTQSGRDGKRGKHNQFFLHGVPLRVEVPGESLAVSQKRQNPKRANLLVNHVRQPSLAQQFREINLSAGAR